MIDHSTNDFLYSLEKNFNSKKFNNEDDVKIQFHAEIVKPILEKLALETSNFSSETSYYRGGKADATYQNLAFEYKEKGKFKSHSGINEALYGRDTKDRGLHDYLISNAEIQKKDTPTIMLKKLTSNYGVGFDGEKFLFARFAQTSELKEIDTKKTALSNEKIELPVDFVYEQTTMKQGLRRLAILFLQSEKLALTKSNILSLVNPRTDYVRESIKSIYYMLEKTIEYPKNLNNEYSERARTLFEDWDRVFGTIYGKEEDETNFTEIVPVLKVAYGIDLDEAIDSKKYIFALQTFFNIFLKLLVNSFLSRLINPMFNHKTVLTKKDIIRLFDGEDPDQNKFVRNFFESHYLEWFTYTTSSNSADVTVVNKTLEIIDKFDLSTFVLKPEAMQDILQEIYMELIPKELRHIMGEYFSPDWIVEHVLDMVDYQGDDINKKLIDPTCGSGPFITQALKRIIHNKQGVLDWNDVETISQNICGFDINPISVVSAKANFIITVFSAYFSGSDFSEEIDYEPIDIPIYIADSVLSPVVYSEENDHFITTKTVVGEFTIPKFTNIRDSNTFLRLLSQDIHEKSEFEYFWNSICGLQLVQEKHKESIEKLYDRLYELHRSGKDSFWPIILKNSFAPIMITEKFDYVVGNPPWIGWKSMSKSYRTGTLDVWQSYGIFNKNAYDKKTTHDDFGMAVTYVAIDQYLKSAGLMCFLLPAPFLKSTKGGEGFRKLRIVRNSQEIPFAIERVDDFSGVNLFSINTIAVQFKKNVDMKYPLNNYNVWKQKGKKNKIDSHSNWKTVEQLLIKDTLLAQPINKTDSQSAWLTLHDLEFAEKIITNDGTPNYRGRKGIEPAGAKGIYILNKPKKTTKKEEISIINDISRQKRKDLLKLGAKKAIIESEFVYPMLGGRNIERWRVKSHEYILMPHDKENLYGVPVLELARRAPKTFRWLKYYEDGLLKSRIQNGKFFNKERHPFYRLDNVGTYTFSPYKVLWKEQSRGMSAVVVGSYKETITEGGYDVFSEDKVIVVDSKVLMLSCDDSSEAYYVAGVLNAPSIREVIDGYAIETNRGIDVLKYINLPKYKEKDHKSISDLSKKIHDHCKRADYNRNILNEYEKELDIIVRNLFL